jgi:hypothetical protein
LIKESDNLLSIKCQKILLTLTLTTFLYQHSKFYYKRFKLDYKDVFYYIELDNLVQMIYKFFYVDNEDNLSFIEKLKKENKKDPFLLFLNEFFSLLSKKGFIFERKYTLSENKKKIIYYYLLYKEKDFFPNFLNYYILNSLIHSDKLTFYKGKIYKRLNIFDLDFSLYKFKLLYSQEENY